MLRNKMYHLAFLANYTANKSIIKNFSGVRLCFRVFFSTNHEFLVFFKAILKETSFYDSPIF